MASSEDAVRNFVYDFAALHHRNLKVGWEMVQQLERERLCSWERIHAAFPVASPNEARWGPTDEERVALFAKTCPLLGSKLAAQLAAQAAIFLANHSEAQRLARGNSVRLGSLGERINRLYFREKAPAGALTKAFSSAAAAAKLRGKSRLLSFDEAVQRPGFLA